MSEARKLAPADGPAIPDKLYFRIGEVARLVGVETHTLRFWEGEFPQLRVGKGGTGQRLYRRRDVDTLLEIKHLLYEQGYTIPGARQILRGRSARGPAPAELPFPSPGRETSPAVGRAAKSAGMERMRSELRDLSRLLASPPGGSPEILQNQTPMPSAIAAGSEHGAPAGRRVRGTGALHLAAEPVRASPAPPVATGLFSQNDE